MRDVANALTHSLELVIAMGVGIWLGWKAQQWWPGIEPWGLVGGAMLGAGAVLRSIWRILAESAPARARDAREHARE